MVSIPRISFLYQINLDLFQCQKANKIKKYNIQTYMHYSNIYIITTYVFFKLKLFKNLYYIQIYALFQSVYYSNIYITFHFRWWNVE